ncbi:MAG: hypothetical protein ABWY52_02255 [Candidatus Limnocylindrales bacterium]
MEWLVIGIGIVVGVLILAVIVRSRQGPYSPGMEATGGLAAFGATMAATQDEDQPTSPDEDALDEHGADDAGADDADGAGNGGGEGGGDGGGDGSGD